MKANELRIGNYLQSKKEKSLTMVTDIVSNNDFIECYIWCYGYCQDEVEPIPLTEDWLLKFGFDKDTFGDYYELVLNGFTLLSGDRCGYFDVFELDHNDLRVRYVHQLQNLYFALTGTELTLKTK